ncbi:MAG: hypothetical protein Ct9H300mP27_00300 [Chloroflexota bacterium]|nr:MAG: hypothetical protein Ct9H300mP27_00300 [Chloroflexota bacterium]
MIRNNGDGAKDFKISQTPIENPLKENWTDFYHYQPGRIIQTILLFQDYLVVSIRDKGLPKLEVIHLDSGTNQSIYFDEEDYNVRPQQGREWNTSVLRFSYASLTTPSTIFDYDMANNSRELKKKTRSIGWIRFKSLRQQEGLGTSGGRHSNTDITPISKRVHLSMVLHLYIYMGTDHTA